MSMQDYEAAVTLMEQYPDQQDFVGPQDEALIAAAEQALGLRFPPTYRRFLRSYGCGNFGAAEVYGILKADFANSGVPDGIWYTLQERRDSALPQSYVVVYNDGTGGLYCLDTSRTDGTDEAAVVRYEPGGADQPAGEIVAADFGSLLLELVSEGAAA